MNPIIEKKLGEIKSTFWSFFIRKRPVAWLVVVGIIALGAFSYSILPREINPEINMPYGTIITTLPGANPTDTESLITEPIEKQVGSVSGIKNLSSDSGFGISSISIEFESNIDLNKGIQDVKDAVDRAKPDLPQDATDPIVSKTEANSTTPIITFSLIGDFPLTDLTKIAEDIQESLEKIEGVSEIEILGSQSKEIQVKLNQQKAEKYSIDIQMVSDIIKYSNFNLPVGIISVDKLNYSARIDNRIQALQELKNLPILTLPDENSTQILLSDIAQVEEIYPEQTIISKLSVQGEKSLSTISLRLYKKNDTNILKIADEAKEKMEELKKSIIPDSIEVTISNDNSKFIKKDLGVLTRNGLQTTVLIIFILFLALGFKEGFIAGLSIPLSFLFTFSVMNFFGLTINSLSLFSLVIALGLMVDTAIVIMEGIYENMKKGLNSQDAALMSVQTYKWPLIAGTLTTIFAFSPMLLMGGIMGEFLKQLPITISAALFGSIFISLTVGPSIAARLLKNRKIKNKTSILEPIFNKLGKLFYKFIYAAVNKRSTRVKIILISLIAFAASMALPITGILKTEMFTHTDMDYFIADIETPVGTSLKETQKIVTEFEQYLYKTPEIDNFLTVIGSSQAMAFTDLMESTTSLNENIANITINLKDEKQRERKSYEVANEIREICENYQNAKIKIRELSEGPPTEAAITVRITGKDLDTLKQIASDIEIIMTETKKTQNIENSLTQGLTEFKFKLDREKVSYHGLSIPQVSATVRGIVQGIKASSITLGEDDIDIIVKYNSKEKSGQTKLSINELENFEIPTPKGYNVNLEELGNYELQESLSSISRENQKRIIKVTSEVKAGKNSKEITEEIQDKVKEYKLSNGYNIEFGGDLEGIKDSFNGLYQSMFIGLLFIIFTLVLIFNSFKQPIIIILTLPLALIGVFPGLMLIGLNLSFPAFIGVVALSGIVVNDAIVLIDRINTNRKNNMEFTEAIAEAANARLQPIFMTSLTTIVGILPLALTNELWGGLGFSIVFGLGFSTILTLIVIPVLYYMFEARGERKRLAKL